MMTKSTLGLCQRSLRCGVAVMAIMAASAAHADTNPPAADQNDASLPANGNANAPAQGTLSEAQMRDIIVTGTLIRGKAPTGQELVTVSSADIAQLGATNTSQILATLPQDANFNGRPQVGGFGQYQTVNAPILRNLGGGSSGNNSTLLLVDGARLPGMGIQQTVGDMDAIAPGALQRVDAATDGGSATYGADAVGGVVNLITRKRFDGLEVGGHFGGADKYRQWDASGTIGKSWDKGSIWLSYQYAHNDMLLNSARSYSHNLDYTTATPSPANLYCNPGNFVAGGYVAIPTPPYYKLVTTTYPVVNGVPVSGTPNRCDISQGKAMVPAQSRHSVLAGMDVELASWLTFDVKAFYMYRQTYAQSGHNYYTGVPATACVYGAYCGLPGVPNTTGTVSGYFADPDAAFQVSPATTTLNTWGVIPRLTAKFGHDWQLTAFLNVAEGYNAFEAPYNGGDAVALASEVASGAFNPFTGLFANTAAGQAARAYQAKFYGFSSGKDSITQTRAVFDGPLFSLPGGEVRAALGGEYYQETFIQRNGQAETGDFSSIVPHRAYRNVKSGFGELSVPIVGEDNRFAGVYALTLSAAGRYDSYSDFGNTFNPKFGASLKPTSWWTLRGNWGKSYQAPSLATTAAAIPPSAVAVPASAFGGNPAYPNTAGQTILLLFPGGGIGLKPQKATTWEVGTDFKPDFFPGFSASVTYYNIDFKDRIANPAFYASNFYALYPTSYIMNTPSAKLTSAQIASYIALAQNASQFQQYVNNPDSVYALENGLSQNISAVKTSGLDFNVSYTHPTGFGSVFGNVAGSYILTYQSQATPTSTAQGLDANNVIRLRTTASLGTTIGALLAKVTWNRTGDFKVAPFAGNAFQTKVSAFNTINLAFQYAPHLGGVFKGVALNLNVDNLFDQDPPLWRGNSTGTGYDFSGFTLGRMITVGIKKTF